MYLDYSEEVRGIGLDTCKSRHIQLEIEVEGERMTEGLKEKMYLDLEEFI